VQFKLTRTTKCDRLGKTCEYPASRKPYGTGAFSIAESQDIVVAAPFPDAFFIDASLFRPIPHTVSTSYNLVPTQVLQLLAPDKNAVCEAYFNSVDTWLPFISKRRIMQAIQKSKFSEAPDLCLLLLCMKLITQVPLPKTTSAAGTVLYRQTRSYLNSVEESLPLSLHVLQSLILVSLYEIGHGIFPAAYLTVSRAARLGLLRGVHDRNNATQLFQTPPTWTYWEEERRTWWAVYVLEL